MVYDPSSLDDIAAAIGSPRAAARAWGLEHARLRYLTVPPAVVCHALEFDRKSAIRDLAHAAEGQIDEDLEVMLGQAYQTTREDYSRSIVLGAWLASAPTRAMQRAWQAIERYPHDSESFGVAARWIAEQGDAEAFRALGLYKTAWNSLARAAAQRGERDLWDWAVDRWYKAPELLSEGMAWSLGLGPRTVSPTVTGDGIPTALTQRSSYHGAPWRHREDAAEAWRGGPRHFFKWIREKLTESKFELDESETTPHLRNFDMEFDNRRLMALTVFQDRLNAINRWPNEGHATALMAMLARDTIADRDEERSIQDLFDNVHVDESEHRTPFERWLEVALDRGRSVPIRIQHLKAFARVAALQPAHCVPYFDRATELLHARHPELIRGITEEMFIDVGAHGVAALGRMLAEEGYGDVPMILVQNGTREAFDQLVPHDGRHPDTAWIDALRLGCPPGRIDELATWHRHNGHEGTAELLLDICRAQGVDHHDMGSWSAQCLAYEDAIRPAPEYDDVTVRRADGRPDVFPPSRTAGKRRGRLDQPN